MTTSIFSTSVLALLLLLFVLSFSSYFTYKTVLFEFLNFFPLFDSKRTPFTVRKSSYEANN